MSTNDKLADALRRIANYDPWGSDEDEWVTSFALVQKWASEALAAHAASLAAPPAQGECNVEGSWLWLKLMDWCKQQRIAPATQNALFAIAAEAHKLYAPQPAPAPVKVECSASPDGRHAECDEAGTAGWCEWCSEQIEQPVAAAQPPAPVQVDDSARGTLALIDALRADEGASVTICGDNPDGPPNCGIYVNDAWTGWTDVRFEGETLQLCLRNALDAKRAAPDDVPVDASYSKHDQEIIADLEAMARNQAKGYWPKMLAICALRMIREARAAQPPAPAPVQVENYRDAYEGAREDLLDWKRRALRAEATLRTLGYTGIDASQPPAPGEAELPPLPEPAIYDRGRFGVCYSADQMLDYARAAIAALAQQRVDLEQFREPVMFWRETYVRLGMPVSKIAKAQHLIGLIDQQQEARK